MTLHMTIVGYLGQDPRIETVNTKNGPRVVTKLNVAAKDTRGETCWLDVTDWNSDSTKNHQNYLHKGDQVTVIGTLSTPTIYSRKDGTMGVNMSINASNINYPKRGDSTGSTPNPDAPATSNKPAAAEADIPF